MLNYMKTNQTSVLLSFKYLLLIDVFIGAFFTTTVLHNDYPSQLLSEQILDLSDKDLSSDSGETVIENPKSLSESRFEQSKCREFSYNDINTSQILSSFKIRIKEFIKLIEEVFGNSGELLAIIAKEMSMQDYNERKNTLYSSNNFLKLGEVNQKLSKLVGKQALEGKNTADVKSDNNKNNISERAVVFNTESDYSQLRNQHFAQNGHLSLDTYSIKESRSLESPTRSHKRLLSGQNKRNIEGFINDSFLMKGCPPTINKYQRSPERRTRVFPPISCFSCLSSTQESQNWIYPFSIFSESTARSFPKDERPLERTSVNHILLHANPLKTNPHAHHPTYKDPSGLGSYHDYLSPDDSNPFLSHNPPCYDPSNTTNIRFTTFLNKTKIAKASSPQEAQLSKKEDTHETDLKGGCLIGTRPSPNMTDKWIHKFDDPSHNKLNRSDPSYNGGSTSTIQPMPRLTKGPGTSPIPLLAYRENLKQPCYIGSSISSTEFPDEYTNTDEFERQDSQSNQSDKISDLPPSPPHVFNFRSKHCQRTGFKPKNENSNSLLQKTIQGPIPNHYHSYLSDDTSNTLFNSFGGGMSNISSQKNKSCDCNNSKNPSVNKHSSFTDEYIPHKQIKKQTKNTSSKRNTPFLRNFGSCFYSKNKNPRKQIHSDKDDKERYEEIYRPLSK